ncbi:MAG: hypothetical protein UX87_C0026G0003 [Candidatus Amesbacteria bacterium GW2011_GWA1_47_16]|uniref:Uncharacterized protein n=2 Tax=Candidatus Amesiibacteriota TaxID=1752730 RepID=A0A0G1XTD7_9BACT|nr:MAG: hypothetical protein UX87_C0026G0003 [Candidatus Amesbacteria bacterium GW2011_GWA1_47_16]KKU97580.1 MAG: hypothetical protein UY28_C0018G0010 [Candidatus Amesbacteria bacterium GW2011_GWB1_48_13]
MTRSEKEDKIVKHSYELLDFACALTRTLAESW